jgi:hypothetical protein
LLSNIHLYISISWKNSFHFMTQEYQNFRYREKRTGPKSPTLCTWETLRKIIVCILKKKFVWKMGGIKSLVYKKKKNQFEKILNLNFLTKKSILTSFWPVECSKTFFIYHLSNNLVRDLIFLCVTQILTISRILDYLILYALKNTKMQKKIKFDLVWAMIKNFDVAI